MNLTTKAIEIMNFMKLKVDFFNLYLYFNTSGSKFTIWLNSFNQIKHNR